MRSSWLDLKLALRMLVKYPGLSAVAGLAIAVAIGLSAAFFEFTHDLVSPHIPLDEGERVVALQNWDTTANAPDRRSLGDFVAWRAQLTSVQDLGAFHTIKRNLITDDGRVEPVDLAEVSASAFRVARVPPLLGRPMVDADEQPEAAAVAVLGYGLWHARFRADPDIVGRTVRLGQATHTVVGVMPEGFTFPVSHRLWIPLRATAAPLDRSVGPSIRIFGRLAPNATMASAQTELAAIGARAAADAPATHGRLRPQVVPYAASFLDPDLTLGEMYVFQVVLIVVLIVCAANVATLVFARTATREGEIAVRSALGASRSRIVTQLFIEALALSSVAAMVGLAAATALLRWAMALVWSAPGRPGRPFWWNDTLAPETLLYVAALTMLCAIVSGVVPALKGTQRRLQTSLQQIAGRGSSLRFGHATTIVIVAQVALSVAFLPRALSEGWDAARAQANARRTQTEAYLAARIEMDPADLGERDDEATGPNAALAAAYEEIARRVAEEPGSLRLTFADVLPGMEHPERQIEVAAADASIERPRVVRVASVAVNFFDALDTTALVGRTFHAGDLSAATPAAIVNQSFVQHVFSGRNPIGLRVREVDTAIDRAQPWLEIVGVVADLGMNDIKPAEAAGLYRVIPPGQMASMRLAVWVGADPPSFAPRLRTIAMAVDPTLRLYDLVPLDEMGRADRLAYRLFAAVLVFVASIAVLLSTAGIYSLMSFTVSQRTREIGIRTALGADPRRLVAAIFSRAFAQIGIGIAAGIAILVLAGTESSGDAGLLAVVATIVLAAGLVACGVPAARALRIQPTEALKDA